jgi:hypothetical protein
LQKLFVDKKTQLIIKFKKFIVLTILLFNFAKLGVLCSSVSIKKRRTNKDFIPYLLTKIQTYEKIYTFLGDVGCNGNHIDGAEL